MSLLTEKYNAWAKYPEKYTAKQVLDEIVVDLKRLDDEEVKNCNLADVNGWLDFESNKKLFNAEAKKNCFCKFECGTVIRYNDEHPWEIMTHFKLAEACR